MDISQIRKLIRLISNSDVTEIEVKEGEESIRLVRQSGIMPAIASSDANGELDMPYTSARQDVHSSAPQKAAQEPDQNIMPSPMVGTFYSAPSPETDPFVREGDEVKAGDVLCIIEAMKLMNEIEADYDGVVEKFLVENASPVEYGQPLFIIKPV